MNDPGFDEALIERLLRLPVPARAACLDAAIAENPALRRYVPQILAAVAMGNSLGSVPTPPPPDVQAAQLLQFALETPPENASGTCIGHYKLLQKIGEGGFGIVWMAEQQQPIRRRVAIKIIKSGMDTEETIARFEAERQALALMEHPNIARVFDAGATETGRPYFVMELVRGVAITRYCDETRLSARERLRLFITICQAVQHAHQKGVIHRDLKPSNILVTLHDGVPVPKIIDFGIAKATSARLTEKTLFTQFHAFIGTPAYTSPEQMEMSGLDVDTRSDIYSLGVLLYELLTGQPPFDSDALAKSGLEAMRRTIRETDPPLPSRRLATLNQDNRSTVARQRDTDPAKLALLLRGDLDWIAMRCLEKDRTRRYDSATSLAADVERHLNDDAIQARPPDRLYRARKFVRRHRLAVFAAAAVTVSLIGGLAASSFLLLRERDARRRAVAAEAVESKLRQQADTARLREVKRVALNALTLAEHLLREGKTAEALAYLVHAARKDPTNLTIAPRLASLLASRRFLIPEGAPAQLGSRVLAVQFTRDGKCIQIGTEDGTLRILDTESGETLREIKLARQVAPGGWSFARNNDSICAVRFADNTLGVLDLVSGQLRWTPVTGNPRAWSYTRSTYLGPPMGLSADGRWLFLRGATDYWLWDAATGELRLELPAAGEFAGADLSSDGRLLALAANNTIHLWSISEGTHTEIPIVFPHMGPGLMSRLTVRVSPDSRRLAVCDAFAGAQVYEIASGHKVGELPVWEEYVARLPLEFMPDGRLFVAGNRSAKLWDAGSGRTDSLPVAADNILGDLAFDATGKLLLIASSDGSARLWDTENQTLATFPSLQLAANIQAALSPDGKRLAVAAPDGVHRFRAGGGGLRPLVVPRAPLPGIFLPEAPARLLLFTSTRGRTLDVASGRWLSDFALSEPVLSNGPNDFLPPIRQDLKYYVVRTAREVWQSWSLGPRGIERSVDLQGAPSRDHAVAFSAREDRVALVSNNGLGIWDLRTGARLGPLVKHDTNLIFVSANFSPDGKQLAVGSADGRVMLYDAATAAPLDASFVVTPMTPVYEAQFSPNGTRMATTTNRHDVQFWNVQTGKPLTASHSSIDTLRARFSPDGRWFSAWGSEAVTLWDGRTGASTGIVIPAAGKHVRFSPDGDRLVTTSDSGDVRIWDVRSGRALTEAMPHDGRRVVLAEFSPDGTVVRTEGVRGFSLWPVPPKPRPDDPTPEWLLELANVFSTKTINETEQCVDDHAAASRIDAVRRRVAALPMDAPFAVWGRWILDERPDRPIAPGFSISPATASRLAAEVEDAKP